MAEAKLEVIFAQKRTGRYIEKPGSRRGILFWRSGPEWYCAWEVRVQLECWSRDERDCDDFYVLILTWQDNRTFWKHPYEEHTLLWEHNWSNAAAIREAIRVFDERLAGLEKGEQ